MTSWDPGKLRQQMARLRTEMQHDAAGLADTAQSLTDWRSYIARYPWVALGTSAALGFLLIPKRRPMTAQQQAPLAGRFTTVGSAPTVGHAALRSMVAILGTSLLRGSLACAGKRLIEGLQPPHSEDHQGREQF